jgi:tetratricopeptide (TPR) repeat protein
MKMLALVTAALLMGQAPAEALALNRAGFALYQQGRFEDALEKFRAAAAADDGLAIAHYNAAATMARLRTLNRVCEANAYVSSIFEELERAIALDPRRRTRAREDRDFASVQTSARWQLVVRRYDATRDLAQILIASDWWGPAPGAHGNTSFIVFKADGSVSGWELDPTTDEVRQRPLDGRWVVVRGAVTIRWTSGQAAQTAVTLRLTADGHLVTETGARAFASAPEECSA